MKKVTFKFIKTGDITSIILEEPKSYIDMMHKLMKSTPIEVLSIVDASETEVAWLQSQASYFEKHGTACE